MASKTALVVFLALVALQGTSGNPVNDFVNGVVSALGNIQQLEVTVANRLANVSAAAHQKIEEALAKANATINGYIQKAQVGVAAVQECNSGTSQALKAVGDNFSSTSQTCLDTAVASVQPALEKGAAFVQQYNATAVDLRTKASKCGTGILSIGCQAGLGLEVAKAFTDLSISAISIATNIETEGVKAGAAVITCETDNVKASLKSVTDTIQSVRTCIQSKTN